MNGDLKRSIMYQYVTAGCMKVKKKSLKKFDAKPREGVIQVADFVAEGISRQYTIQYLQERNCERVQKIYIWHWMCGRMICILFPNSIRKLSILTTHVIMPKCYR